MFVISVIAVLWYLFLNCFFPMAEGRDSWTYWAYFRDIFRTDPQYSLLMLFRTPATPLFYGLAFGLGGIKGAMVAACAGYVIIVLVVYDLLTTYRIWVGLMGVLLLFINLRFFERYNSVGSETLQSVLLAIWFWVTFNSMERGGWRLGCALGIVTYLLVMNRPANQLLIPMCILPLLGMWIGPAFSKTVKNKEFIRCAVTGLVVAMAFSLLHASSNYLRYGHFCIAGMGGAHIPFYRLFLQQRLIAPENGPRSAELAALVKKYILSESMCLQYGIDENIFFHHSTQRMFNMLVRKAYAERGWDHDFKLLKDAGWEAIRANPIEGWLGYVDGVLGFISIPEGHHPFVLSNMTHSFEEFNDFRTQRYKLYKEKGIPIPDKGDLIPGNGWLQEQEGAVPVDSVHWDYARRVAPSPNLERWIAASNLFSPTWITLLIGIIGSVCACFNRSTDLRIPLILLAALPSLLVTWFGILLKDFRYPFDPLFTIFICWGVYCISRVVNDLKKSRPFGHEQGKLSGCVPSSVKARCGDSPS